MKKKFNTAFSTDGWLGLYIAGMVLNLFMNVISIPLPYIVTNSTVSVMLRAGIAIIQILTTTFFISAAYTKAILVFINSLSLGEKKFSIKLTFGHLFSLVIANILVSIFTLGIYLPWAYKSIIDRIANSLEYGKDGRLNFLSKAAQLFVFISASLITMLVMFAIFVASLTIFSGNKTMFKLIILPICLILFFAILAIIAVIQVFTINWFCNFNFSSTNKNTTYTLDINIVHAIMFYLGQIVLLCLTLGFYAGAYLINMYEYFAMRIVEKKNNETTGRILFIKPLDRGAGFLLMQSILSVLTAGIYTPFAYVEYVKFFLNNTYLETSVEDVEPKEELEAVSSN